MDFAEFMDKYEKLKGKVESEKKNKVTDFIDDFKKNFPRNFNG